jgi:hypothetical protein
MLSISYLENAHGTEGAELCPGSPVTVSEDPTPRFLKGGRGDFTNVLKIPLSSPFQAFPSAFLKGSRRGFLINPPSFHKPKGEDKEFFHQKRPS